MSRQVDQLPNYQNGRGEFRGAYHVDMVRDPIRVGALVSALEKSVIPGMTLLDSGSGTRLLAIAASRLGAQATALEVDVGMIPILSNNIKNSGFDIKILHNDVFDLENSEQRFDIAIVEMMSIWCIEEPQVVAANFIREHLLHEGGVLFQRG